METMYDRTELLLGEDGVRKLAAARVAVFGLGGVGGYAAEALARAGVGAMELFDHDTVSVTNLNRQILALRSTLGRYKVEVMAARIGDINPEAEVVAHRVFYGAENAEQYDLSRYDYIVDAIDSVSSKLLLIERAYRAGTPIVSAMGAGNKLDAGRFEVADIRDTSVCPLARVVRKALKERGIPSLRVVYSRELPVAASHPPGSISYAPAVCGLLLAGEVIRALAFH